MTDAKQLVRERRVGAAMERIGDQLRTFRKLQKLTVQQVAERSGLSRGTVTRLESGDDGVTMSSFLSVCRSLGVLELMLDSLDPYATAIGRAQASRGLPQRIRHG